MKSAPTVSSWTENRLDVFVIGTNDGLFQKCWDGRWSKWNYLGGTIKFDPAAVSSDINNIDIVAVGVNSNLYHKSWNPKENPSQPWSIWKKVDETTIVSSPSVVTTGLGKISVFASVLENCRPVFKYRNCINGEWTQWATLRGRLISNPTSVSLGPGRIDIFAQLSGSQSLSNMFTDDFTNELSSTDANYEDELDYMNLATGPNMFETK